MATSHPVSEQITDSVTQARHISVGSASAMAIGSSLQAMAHAAGLNMLNATHAYQQWSILNQATITQAAVRILSTAPGTAGGAGGTSGAAGESSP